MKTILSVLFSILPITAGAQKAGVQKLDSVINQTWDYHTERFYLDTKFVYTYGFQGDVTLFTCYHYDSVKQWFNFYRNEFAYDASGNKIEDIFSTYLDSTDKWIVRQKTENTYNANNQEVKTLIVLNDPVTNLLIDSTKTEYTYDLIGNLVLSKFGYRGARTSRWVDADEIRYAYNDQREVTSEMDYFWNLTSNRLVNNHNIEYSYDVNGKVIMEVNYEWDPLNDTLFPSSKFEYTYDSYGNRTLTTPYFWHEGKGWEIGRLQKTDYTYDAGGHPLLVVGSNWDVATNQWYVWQQLERTYDSNGNMTSSFSYYGKEPTNNFRFYNSKSNLYYSDLIVTSVPELIPGEMRVFPNPGNGKFSVSSSNLITSIEIYDMLGKMVYSDINPTQRTINEIDISAQAKGIYFLKIQKGSRVQTSKIIIQ